MALLPNRDIFDIMHLIAKDSSDQVERQTFKNATEVTTIQMNIVVFGECPKDVFIWPIIRTTGR